VESLESLVEVSLVGEDFALEWSLLTLALHSSGIADLYFHAYAISSYLKYLYVAQMGHSEEDFNEIIK